MKSRHRQAKHLGVSRRIVRVEPRRPRRVNREPGPRYLCDEWRRIVGRLRAAPRIVLFLDFDGTLAPLQVHPEGVWLDDDTRHLLDRLARRIKIFVISGRRRADLRRRVRVSAVECLGLYGWEGRTKGSKRSGDRRLIDGTRRLAETRLGRLPGIRIENKGPLFTVHFRGAPPDAIRQAKAAVRKIVAPRKPDLRLLTNKSAWEILPRDFKGKGAVVENLLSASPPDTLAVYFGDDGPDEEAFQVLRDGLTVVVGRRSLTAARYYVRNSAEVKRILTRLEAAIA